MKCEIIHDLLDRYVDHTCSEETRKEVEEHLKECEKCRALYEEIKNTNYEVPPAIDEKKPFIKIRHALRNCLIIILFLILTIFCLNIENIKFKIAQRKIFAYVEEKYPDDDFRITTLQYMDPSEGYDPAECFDETTKYYVARYCVDKEKDEYFYVYIDASFRTICDNYGDAEK